MTDPWQMPFARFLDAAAPYLDQLVIAGGWANRLYPLTRHANQPDFAPLVTKDVDAATPSRLHGHERLDQPLSDCGFRETFASDFTPPIARYAWGRQEGLEVEFIADLPGGYDERDGTPNATLTVAGVTAQKLHYVRRLLIAPWTVTVRRTDGYPLEAVEVTVRIPNPVSYMAQKLLIHKQRGMKAAKDVLYIHDTLQIFGQGDEMLRDEWRRLRTEMPTNWRTRCRARSIELRSPEHRYVVQAAMIAKDAGRSTSVYRVARVLQAGLAFLHDE